MLSMQTQTRPTSWSRIAITTCMIIRRSSSAILSCSTTQLAGTLTSSLAKGAIAEGSQRQRTSKICTHTWRRKSPLMWSSPKTSLARCPKRTCSYTLTSEIRIPSTSPICLDSKKRNRMLSARWTWTPPPAAISSKIVVTVREKRKLTTSSASYWPNFTSCQAIPILLAHQWYSGSLLASSERIRIYWTQRGSFAWLPLRQTSASSKSIWARKIFTT